MKTIKKAIAEEFVAGWQIKLSELEAITALAKPNMEVNKFQVEAVILALIQQDYMNEPEA